MSQRRAPAGNPSPAVTQLVEEDIAESKPLTGTLQLDDGSDDDCDENVPLNDDHQAERHKRRLKKWRESPFAAGLTEPDWIEERTRPSVLSRAYGDSEVEPDDTGCLCISAQICPMLGADRVGNMAVLKSSQEWVEEVTQDEETGENTIRRYTRPRLDIVVGPYWPMMLCVTYPIILAVSGWTYWSGIRPGGKPFQLVAVWFICTVGLIAALGCTAFRDPGIMYKHQHPPPQNESTWRWTDQAQTYRPRGAYYDRDTAVVVEGFDHTCPWTGTAIGKRNMLAFQFFVCLVFVCMIIDIFILTGAF